MCLSPHCRTSQVGCTVLQAGPATTTSGTVLRQHKEPLQCEEEGVVWGRRGVVWEEEEGLSGGGREEGLYGACHLGGRCCGVI